MDACTDGIALANQLYPGKDLRHFLIHCDDTTPGGRRQDGQEWNRPGAPTRCSRHHLRVEHPVLTAKEEVFSFQAYTDMGVNLTGGSDAPCPTP